MYGKTQIATLPLVSTTGTVVRVPVLAHRTGTIALHRNSTGNTKDSTVGRPRILQYSCIYYSYSESTVSAAVEACCHLIGLTAVL